MSIDKLTYVSCDVCGSSPTEPVIGGAREARASARAEGYVRRSGQDICPRCLAARPATDQEREG